MIISFWLGYSLGCGKWEWMDGWMDGFGYGREDDTIGVRHQPRMQHQWEIMMTVWRRICYQHTENTWTLGWAGHDREKAFGRTSVEYYITELQLCFSRYCHYGNHIVNPQPSNKTFKIKRILGKKQKQNRPIPQWIRLRTDNKIRYNAKRRHWRRTKLNI
ncbi:ribosomal L39 protein-domain-containing protein [Endogone sp. FLAS-F59071]|nr:ribosomal L39 protein-domain-containing protein [Endogone sp. FLAS-F59071]|eukprot:RUS16784.1 ribosomal L39 protein-domain-containing protein [Endogone sp. FLAS-F59071]